MNNWEYYDKYITTLVNIKNPKQEDIAYEATQAFPIIAKITKRTTHASRFIKTILHIFKTKTTTKNVLDTLKKLFPIFELMYDKPRTLRQRLSDVRKVIKKYQSEEAYLKSKYDAYFNMNATDRSLITDAYKRQVTNKNKKKIQIDMKMIFDKMQKLIQSDNVYDRIIALMLALGTRPIELFAKNNFSLIKDKHSWIRVSGLAKKRETQEKKWTDRPVVYFTPRFVIKEVKAVRNHFKKLIVINGNGKLATDKSQSLNKRAVLHFPFLKDIHQKSSFLRKIYADLSFKLFADKRTQNFNTWISDVLGHGPLDLSTSFSYSYVNVQDSKEVKDESVIAQLNELRAQVKLLMDRSISELALELKQPPEPKRQGNKTEDKKKKKFIILEKLYNEGVTTNAGLRKKAKMGSRIVGEFLKKKKDQ